MRVDIGFMIPSEGDIDDVGKGFAPKLFDVFGAIVGVVLLNVHLLSLSPHINIGVHLCEARSTRI